MTSDDLSDSEMRLLALGAAMYGTNTDASRIIATALDEMQRLKRPAATDTRLLDAVLTLADRELTKFPHDADRAGALRALLREAIPFLRQLRELSASEVTA